VDTNVPEERAGSFFRIEVSVVRIQSGYMGRLQERWPPLRLMGKGEQMELGIGRK
jgi:hypothetical protein